MLIVISFLARPHGVMGFTILRLRAAVHCGASRPLHVVAATLCELKFIVMIISYVGWQAYSWCLWRLPFSFFVCSSG